jgi:hypothetical protein
MPYAAYAQALRDSECHPSPKTGSVLAQDFADECEWPVSTAALKRRCFHNCRAAQSSSEVLTCAKRACYQNTAAEAPLSADAADAVCAVDAVVAVDAVDAVAAVAAADAADAVAAADAADAADAVAAADAAVTRMPLVFEP